MSAGPLAKTAARKRPRCQRRDRSVVTNPVSTVRVELGARSYDVLIGSGLLASLPARLRDMFGAVKCGVVTGQCGGGASFGNRWKPA